MNAPSLSQQANHFKPTPSAEPIHLSQQDGYKLAEKNRELFRKLAEKLREQHTQSTGSPHLGSSELGVLLQRAHQRLSERMNEGKLFQGDHILIVKDWAYCQATSKVSKTIDLILLVEKQLQRLLDRDIGAVWAWEEATLDMDEALLESFVDIGEVKEFKAELVSRRAIFEERLRRDRKKRDREMKDEEMEGGETKDKEAKAKEMDAFEKMVMGTVSGGHGA